jgi:hypothetical protein
MYDPFCKSNSRGLLYGCLLRGQIPVTRNSGFQHTRRNRLLMADEGILCVYDK